MTDKMETATAYPDIVLVDDLNRRHTIEHAMANRVFGRIYKKLPEEMARVAETMESAAFDFDKAIVDEILPLRLYCRYLLNDTEQAKDLCAESLAKAARCKHLYDHRGVFQAWLRKIAKNLFITNYKNGKKLQIISIDGMLVQYEPSHVSALSSLYSRENFLLAIKLARHFCDISKNHCKDRLFLRLLVRYSKGYLYRELAERYNLPEGTVKNMLFVVRSYIKTYIS